MIGPVYGAIENIHYVHCLSRELAILWENMEEVLFVILYENKENELLMIELYLMGFLGVFHDEFIADRGEIVDVYRPFCFFWGRCSACAGDGRR
jgi:hypothetical protein